MTEERLDEAMARPPRTPRPSPSRAHAFEAYDGSSGFACTAMVMREGHGEDCGLPASDPAHTPCDPDGPKCGETLAPCAVHAIPPNTGPQPPDEPEVYLSWSDDGIHVVCERESCMTTLERLPGRRFYWTSGELEFKLTPERAQQEIDDHLASRTHRGA
jgi:hypothetical protein